MEEIGSVILDQSALERYRLKLRHKVSYHLGGSSPDVEDVVQEVMLRFVRALKTEKMRNPDSIAALLGGICNNVIYEYKRRQRKEPVPNPDASPESPAGLGADTVELRQVIGLVMNQLAPGNVKSCAPSSWRSGTRARFAGPWGFPRSNSESSCFESRKNSANFINLV
jgi:hypothetical protein